MQAVTDVKGWGGGARGGALDLERKLQSGDFWIDWKIYSLDNKERKEFFKQSKKQENKTRRPKEKENQLGWMKVMCSKSEPKN